jgi:transcriptional regulator with XRE-family HTH domain
MSRYEIKNVQPPADVLKRLADVFGVSIDYIVNGTLEQKAERSLDDNELLQQFKEVEQMNDDDRSTIKKLIDAFITKKKMQHLVQ